MKTYISIFLVGCFMCTSFVVTAQVAQDTLGERKNYHESGPLKSQYSYKDALINGSWVGYYENAKLAESGAYAKGQRDGAWKEYHKNGKLKGEGKYKAGKKVGTWKMYYKLNRIR